MTVQTLTPAEVETLRERYRAQVSKEWRYEQFFKFLQLSPSYRLARLKASGKLEGKKIRFPSDFDVVERTYAACGDVTKTHFWEWWLATGQYALGSNVRSRPRLLLKVSSGQPAAEEDVLAAQDALKEFAVLDRVAEGQPSVLVAAIPLSGGRNAILRAFNQLLAQHLVPEDDRKRLPDFKFETNKIRQSTVAAAGAMTVLRAANPKAELYLLGNRQNVSKHVTPKQRSRAGLEGDRRVMEIMTSRQLLRAYILAEWAARCRFPYLEKLPDDPGRPKMDYVKLGKQISITIRTLERQLAEYRKENPHWKPRSERDANQERAMS